MTSVVSASVDASVDVTLGGDIDATGTRMLAVGCPPVLRLFKGRPAENMIS